MGRLRIRVAEKLNHSNYSLLAALSLVILWMWHTNTITYTMDNIWLCRFETMPRTDNFVEFLPQKLNMCKEYDRLLTFKDWNTKKYGPLQSTLATAGFWYSGRDGVVECFCCRIRFACDTAKTDIVREHRLVSPKCLFNQQNIPWLPCQTGADRIADRGQTGTPRSPLLFQVPEEHMSPNQAKMSQMSRDGKENKITPKKKWKFRKYAKKRARMETYKNWPHHISYTPEQLAECGFFSLEFDDRIECFCCGVVLRNLKRIKDPWLEHAQMHPSCRYLRKMKSLSFILAAVKQCPSFTLSSTKLYDDKSSESLGAGILETAGATCGHSPSTRPSSSSSDSSEEEDKVSEEDLKSLRDQSERLKDDRLCAVCLGESVSTVFVCCGHLACETCARQLDRCHMCRGEVRHSKEVIFHGVRSGPDWL